jgi:hypothetical protein
MCSGRGGAIVCDDATAAPESDPPEEALLWRPMSGSRRIVPVLATAVLAASAAPARAQSGAGDDQYTDPFGGSTQKKTSTNSPARGRSASKSQAGGPPLSNQPPVSSSGPSTTTTTPTQAPAATAQLPRTGLEVPGIALLGAGLLASGIGLRLRTVDESLF